MLSQRVWAIGTRLATRTAQKSASVSIRGKRTYLIGAYTTRSCLQHRSLSYSCVRPSNSFPGLWPSARLPKSRPNACNGGGQMRLMGDKRSFHTSLCARWSTYLPPASRLLCRRTLLLQLGNTASQDPHLVQGTHYYVPSWSPKPY